LYYYDQIQGLMALNNFDFCDTVVMGSTHTEVRRFFRNEAYWSEVLFPALRRFYFEEFVPRVNARLQGRLARGAIYETMTVPKGLSSLFKAKRKPENPLPREVSK
jgi:hypothetical protein